MKIVYQIDDITEYGKLMAYCIRNDINVWRTYWNEREAGDRCYDVDFVDKCCYYSDARYYIGQGYTIVKPQFVVDEWGNYKIAGGEVQ